MKKTDKLFTESSLREETVSSREAYSGSFLHVYHDEVSLPNGGGASREYIRHVGAVCIVALDEQGRIAMERKVLENIEFYYGGRCAVITVTRDMIKETGCPLGDLDGVTAMWRQIEGVQIGVTIKEKPDGKYKVSLRTFEPYNAADICAVFGGGGHIRAAGCEFSCDIESAKRQLLSAIGEVLR